MPKEKQKREKRKDERRQSGERRRENLGRAQGDSGARSVAKATP